MKAKTTLQKSLSTGVFRLQDFFHNPIMLLLRDLPFLV